ncbi:MAG: glycosyltransferase [Gloeobacteraceae cyanobacterium ES-bin-316]|nr:glycosyltransferase [Ferruginibacter sp.]
MKSNLNVLWLPGWYPNKLDFLPGDFIHRHAMAVSSWANISVLYVTKDTTLAFNKSYIESEEFNGLTIYRGYYNCSPKFTLVSKVWSVLLHLNLLLKLYEVARKSKGNFQLVHVHISLRQGLLAQWLKWKYKIPYLITEQNSWFMPVGNQYYTTSRMLRKVIASNFKNADALHVVSASLGDSLKRKFGFVRSFTLIPNVVDTNIFHPAPPSFAEEKNTFFSITSDVYHKNTDGVLRAFALFLKEGNTALLEIAGPNYEGLIELVKQLAIENSVIFLGSIGYSEIAKKMRDADAFIFFTRYETFGCVMAEALCCGTPVIASRLPVLEENLQENENAIFVAPENEQELAQKMATFIAQKKSFDQVDIAIKAHAKYNYKKVGSDFFELYKNVLAKNIS